ncbi:YlxM family DNA-binding protein [Ethanoligenens harbinense]|uniref:UPF0122 protein Ethha_2071 n=1 Tax=Ethanoligenens harbinense (strain DSM 18485 / JCM 12961 / CGMCC 1.5033 / YUAN-3) TaxID=663278 RepID=E6U3I8_ETHHY|nr:YlxM family DNA-binding protein [Ethanoligenens harbinense]ADU27588.1 helix-turn-helix protein YlxM/p13 family protein [Ethanoligenens harbinense YUAN-3]AVQ96633.1 DNA-binding protein [Ethanoligenens harbinense YUAN-3]AYF39294.1 DNA-binding protein [Ethanoligenens harbinense]AYF42118.1 DNA-binding protein [Ethanoligenens harbinense]QCN92873.1 DNA-binding protein [Ethanoligenens harbinense]
MKEKNLEISFLLDFYGEILTEKQREVIELYYNDDLSLAEIAEHAGITRQGVRDAIKRGESTLLFMEEKLGLAAKFDAMQGTLSSIDRDAAEIASRSERYCVSHEIGDLARRIQKTVDDLRDA